MQAFFGVRWNSPAMADAVQVATPVGEDCLMCGEVIAAGESGILMMMLGSMVEGTGDGEDGFRPEHIECHLRAILGSVAHLEQRCTCYGGSTSETDGRPYRVGARETMSWLVERGR